MANPFPFVAGDVLTAAELNGLGETVSYTPTWTNLTVGNGTVTAFYLQIQDMVYVEVQLVFGSTTAITGPVSFTPPITATTAVQGITGNVYFSKVGSNPFAGLIIFNTTIGLRPLTVSGTSVSSTATSSTVPFTWATGDGIKYTGMYRTS